MTIELFDPAIPDLPGFIRGCVERAGGAVEAGPVGRLEALLPPELEAAASGRSWLRLALDSGGLDDGAEPAMLGSPFLDALIAFAAARGTVASGCIPAGRLKKRGLREEVERTLRFSNCRTRHEYDEPDVLLSATAQFDFKVIFLSEERRERLYVVPVNLFSNQVQPLLAERLAGLTVEGEPTASIAQVPLVPIETAYEAASRALRWLVAEDAARQQVRVAQRFAVEFARISDYYNQVVAGLERRRIRELRRAAGGEPSPSRQSDTPAARDGEPAPPDTSALADALTLKIASVHHERERKLRELGDTYGMRIRARLSSARCLWQPKAFFKVLIDRGSTTRALMLAYDGVLERLELPACETCGRETDRVCVSASARLLCPACAGE